MKVDLPAPLAPTSPCTSPVKSSKLTPRSACTPGKDFEALRTGIASVDFKFRVCIRVFWRSSSVSMPPPCRFTGMPCGPACGLLEPARMRCSTGSVYGGVFVSIRLADKNGACRIDDLGGQTANDMRGGGAPIQAHP